MSFQRPPTGGLLRERAGMLKALNDDVVMTERAFRVEAHHVEGPPPTLCYVAIYVTDTHGQWQLWTDFTFEPFSVPTDNFAVNVQVAALLDRLLH